MKYTKKCNKTTKQYTGGRKRITHKKHHTRKKKFKKLNCSPNKKLQYTCYSPSSLIKLKNEWNKDFPNKKIYSNDPYKIWIQLKQSLDEKCHDEKCWLSQSFISDNLDKNLSHNTFAPNAPPTWKKNPNEWLSSIDLNNVMHQYENKYKNFKFIGPSPIDFDKKRPKRLYQKTKQILKNYKFPKPPQLIFDNKDKFSIKIPVNFILK